jgi:hypothetical protein
MTDKATIVRGLREALDANLPADMRQGIHRAIEFYSGQPSVAAQPDDRPRDAKNGRIIEFRASKVTVNGKTLIDNSRSPFER